jgi:hypothetical protein
MSPNRSTGRLQGRDPSGQVTSTRYRLTKDGVDVPWMSGGRFILA